MIRCERFEVESKEVTNKLSPLDLYECIECILEPYSSTEARCVVFAKSFDLYLELGTRV